MSYFCVQMVHLLFYLMHPYGFIIHPLLKPSHCSYFIKGYIHFQAYLQEAYSKIKATIKFLIQHTDFKLPIYLIIALLPISKGVSGCGGFFYYFLDQNSIAFLLFHYLSGLVSLFSQLQSIVSCSSHKSMYAACQRGVLPTANNALPSSCPSQPFTEDFYQGQFRNSQNKVYIIAGNRRSREVFNQCRGLSTTSTTSVPIV